MKHIFKNKNLRELLFINLLFGATDATFAFRTTFLAANGMSASQIGLVFSVMSIFSMISPVIGGILADKVLTRYRVYIISTFATAVVVGFMPVSATIQIGSMIAAMFLMPMIQLFRPAAVAMVATCTINGVAMEKDVDYSQIRLWMSVGYTAACLIFTQFVRLFGIESIYYSAVVCFVLILLLRKTMQRNETEESAGIRSNAEQNTAQTVAETKERRKNASLKALLTNYYIVTFVILNIVYAAAGNCGAYLSYILDANHIDSAQVGTVAGLKVIGEIVVMMFLPQMKKKFSMTGLQIMAGAFVVMDLIIMQFATTLPMVIFAEMFGGLSNGIYLAVAGLYVRMLAPRGLEATAQSVSSLGSCLGGIIFAPLFGKIIEMHGVLANYRVAIVLQTSWILLFAGTLLFGEKVLKKKNVCSIILLRKGDRVL